MKNIYYKGKQILVTVIKTINKFKINIKKRITIRSKSKGKGFSGTIKRYGFSRNYKTHGNSKAHRKMGSIGMCQDPGRVLKGKKMPGRMGNRNKIFKKIKIFYIKKNNIYLASPIAGSINQNIKIIDSL